MLTQREKTLLNYLKRQTAAVSCQNIALHCGCSINTIRKEIQLLNCELREKGCFIEAEKSQGYRLIISDVPKAESFFSESGLSQSAALANQDFNTDSRYRPYFMIRCLLTSPRPVSLIQLCDHLYCSKSTLLRSLKKCEEYCSIFSLQLKNVRNHGLTISGNEYNKRICLIYQLKAFRKLEMRLQENENRFQYAFQLTDTALYQQIRGLVIDCIHAFPEYQIAFLNIPKLVQYLTLCITRRQYTGSISFTPEQSELLLNSGEYALAQSIFLRFERELRHSFTDMDVLSLTSLLLAFRSVQKLSWIPASQADHFYQTARDAASFLYQKFQLDCLTAEEFAEKLACHLYASRFRLLFGIPDDFEKQALVLNDGSYILDFCLALGSYLKERSHIVLSREEIFSFYYLFSAALHQSLNQFHPLHILLISKFGAEYAEHTAHRLLKIYQNSHLNLDTYIKSVEVCEFSNAAALRYKNYDLLVTDIPAAFFHCDYPIAEIDMQRDLVKASALKAAFSQISSRRYRPYLYPRAIISSFRNKKEVFSGIADFYQKEPSFQRDAFITQLEEYDAFISSERSHHLALFRTDRPFLSDGHVLVFLNRHSILWDEEQCQVFIYYRYGSEPVPVILTLEFLLSRLRKASGNRLTRLMENPDADLLDFLDQI